MLHTVLELKDPQSQSAHLSHELPGGDAVPGKLPSSYHCLDHFVSCPDTTVVDSHLEEEKSLPFEI